VLDHLAGVAHPSLTAWPLMFRESTAKATRRASLPIHAYLGRNGHGKDLAMTHDAMPDMALRLPILTTIPLRDFSQPCIRCGDNNNNGRACAPECGQRLWPIYPYQEPFDSLSKLLGFRDGLVMLSEAQGIVSAREHQGLPYEVADHLRKIRHTNSRFCWNAPDWMAADAILRRVTLAVTESKGRMGVAHPLDCTECGEPHVGKTKHCKSQGRQRLWPDNRLFKWRTYDRNDFDNFNESQTNNTAQKHRKLRPLISQSYWRPGNVVESVYDTFGDVLNLGSVDRGGVCVICGGTRRRRQCLGHDSGEGGPVDPAVTLTDWLAWDEPEDDRRGAPVGGGPVVPALPGRHRA
jgi:hypothetical protein